MYTYMSEGESLLYPSRYFTDTEIKKWHWIAINIRRNWDMKFSRRWRFTWRSPTPKMEAVGSTEGLDNTSNIKWHKNPQDWHLKEEISSNAACKKVCQGYGMSLSRFMRPSQISRKLTDWGHLTMLFQLHRLHSIDWGGKMIIHSEKFRIWKDSVLTYLKVMARHSSETGEKHEKLRSDIP